MSGTDICLFFLAQTTTLVHLHNILLQHNFLSFSSCKENCKIFSGDFLQASSRVMHKALKINALFSASTYLYESFGGYLRP